MTPLPVEQGLWKEARNVPDPLTLVVFGERRHKSRYPIQLELRYRLAAGKQHGSGITMNISSEGVRFRCRESLPINSQITLAISWPVFLNERCGLTLVMSGSVVRGDSTSSAVRVYSYEFRTSGNVLKTMVLPKMDQLQGDIAIPTVVVSGH